VLNRVVTLTALLGNAAALRFATFNSDMLRSQTIASVLSPHFRPSYGCALMTTATSEAPAPAETYSELAAGIDWVQTFKYPAATAMQFGLIGLFFKGLDIVGPMPEPLLAPLFAFLSLRSRLFSCLSANRPPRGGFEVEGKRVATPPETIRPWWTPPGIAFPFIWLTITALRMVSSLFIFKAVGSVLCCRPLLLLALHLSVGDTWNCVTNVEQRKGVSAVGVIMVWASVVAVVKAYYDVQPIAGLVLAPSACWISIASVLTWTIWKMNPPLEPLLPQRGDGKVSDLVLPLVFRPKAAWKVLSMPPVGPPQKKDEAV